MANIIRSTTAVIVAFSLLACGLVLTSPHAAAAGWVRCDLGSPSNTTDPLGGGAVGDGNRDGRTEVYFISGSSGSIYQYANTNNTWDVTSLGVPGTGGTGMDIEVGDADDDGRTEVYASLLTQNSWTYIYQIAYNGSGWACTEMGSVYFCGYSGIEIGDGNNDGRTELYACDERFGRMIQFSKGASWSSQEIGTVPGAPGYYPARYYLHGVAVGDGDNDGRNEVYGAADDSHIYNWRHNGSSWARTDMGISEARGGALGIPAIGDADNDGCNEVYAATVANGTIWRYRWNQTGSTWEISKLAHFGATDAWSRDMCIGDGNSDGMKELYFTSYRPYFPMPENGSWLYQISFDTASGIWECYQFNTGNVGMSALAIASAAGDPGMSEIYAAGIDGHAYQFYMDNVPPANPFVYSDTHPVPGTWYSQNVVHVLWRDVGSDISGIGGYSIAWDTAPYTGPDKTVDIGGFVHDNRSAPLADGGDWYFHIRAMDKQLNWNRSAAHFGPIRIDTVPPDILQFSINGGEGLTNNNIVTLSINATDRQPGSGVAWMSFSNDGNSWSDWEQYSSTRPGWDLTDAFFGGNGSDGQKTVIARAKDLAGNEMPVANRSTDSIFLDRVAPVDASIVINGGAWYTANDTVNLTLSARDPEPASGLGNMSFSNDGLSWSEWTDWAQRASWSLTAGAGGTEGDGIKTVQFRVRDAAGNVGDVASALIILDRGAPGELGIIIDGGADYTNECVASIEISARDIGAGLAEMSLANCLSSLGGWEPLSSLKENWSLVAGNGAIDADGPKAVYLEVRDSAGNVGGPVCDTIFLDRARPGVLCISINNDMVLTNNQNVSLAINATDPEPSSGISAMQFSDDGVTWGQFVPFCSSSPFQFKAPDGQKTVFCRVRDRAGNPSDAQSASITLDTIAPSMFGIRVTGITGSSAVVQWSTDEKTVGEVQFGTSVLYGSLTGDGLFHTSHSVALRGLAPATEYHFRLNSRDRAGNSAGFTPDMVFRTEAAPDTVPPTITDIMVLGVGDDVAVIGWTTNERADGRVDFGTTEQYGLKASDSGFLIRHLIVLTGLQPSTQYHFRVFSVDPAGNTASGPDMTFNTTATPDVIPPVISNVKITGVTDNLAVVSWLSDEPADSLVEFGLAGSFGRTATANGFSTVHQIILAGLEHATTYHFRVASRDPSGNGPAFGPELTFTTGNIPDTQPPAISNMRVMNITANSAVILWDTDEPADGLLEYGLNPYLGASFASDFFSTGHRFVIGGLSPGTTYHFRVRSTDASGNPSQPGAEQTFTTASDHRPQNSVSAPSAGLPWWLAGLLAIALLGCVIGAALFLRGPKRPPVLETAGDIETVDMNEPETVMMEEQQARATPGHRFRAPGVSLNTLVFTSARIPCLNT